MVSFLIAVIGWLRCLLWPLTVPAQYPQTKETGKARDVERAQNRSDAKQDEDARPPPAGESQDGKPHQEDKPLEATIHSLRIERSKRPHQ